MVKITVGVEGMACGMCEAHLSEAVRNAFRVKKVTSSHIKKQTVILAEQDIPEQELKSVVAKAGCDVVSVNSEPHEFSFIKDSQEDSAGKNIRKAPVPWSIL